MTSERYGSSTATGHVHCYLPLQDERLGDQAGALIDLLHAFTT